MLIGAPVFESKFSADERSVEGYAAIFGVKDLGGDVVAPGAFAEAVAQIKAGEVLPMYAEHGPMGKGPALPIGGWHDAAEDSRGLRVVGRIIDTPDGSQVHNLLKGGLMRGLSIGYRVRDKAFEDGARVIKSAELVEVSLVQRPMQPSARVLAVKGDMDAAELKGLLEGLGVDPARVARLVNAWDGDDSRGGDVEALDSIRRLTRALKCTK